MKGWSWEGLAVDKKVGKLHSEYVHHYLIGVLINVVELCYMVGNQTWNSLKLNAIKCASQETDEELSAYWVSYIGKQYYCLFSRDHQGERVNPPYRPSN